MINKFEWRLSIFTQWATGTIKATVDTGHSHSFPTSGVAEISK